MVMILLVDFFLVCLLVIKMFRINSNYFKKLEGYSV